MTTEITSEQHEIAFIRIAQEKQLRKLKGVVNFNKMLDRKGPPILDVSEQRF